MSLSVHYRLFLELMEREKEGIALLRERGQIEREGDNESNDDASKVIDDNDGKHR